MENNATKDSAKKVRRNFKRGARHLKDAPSQLERRVKLSISQSAVAESGGDGAKDAELKKLTEQVRGLEAAEKAANKKIVSMQSLISANLYSRDRRGAVF